MAFLPAPADVFFKRNEPGDPRWGEKVNLDTDAATKWILRGYPDHEGIGLNGGRIGAGEAPDKIRQWFYKTTWSQNSPALKDMGNLQISGELGARHEECRRTLKTALQSQLRSICLGGGHDYGFPDGAAFLDVYASSNPVVINFDAHLDVRPLDRGLSSGTPFFRLLNEFSKFDFYQIGIQPQCNSENYRQWCKDKGGKILSWPELLKDSRSFTEQISALLKLEPGKPDFAKRPAFISLDIDCFNNAMAPGCSQSWPTGFSANQFFPVLEWLKSNLDIRVFSIYEVSPPLDIDSRTSKLAAQWIHQLLSENA